MEYHDGSLLDHSPKMDDEREFTIHETARNFEIDLLTVSASPSSSPARRNQLALNVDVEGWTHEALVLWLDRQVRQMDIHQRELLKWLREAVDYLVIARGIRISSLMRCKFLLARKIQDKIEPHPPGGTAQRYTSAISSRPVPELRSRSTSGSSVTVSFETVDYRILVPGRNVSATNSDFVAIGNPVKHFLRFRRCASLLRRRRWRGGPVCSGH